MLAHAYPSPNCGPRRGGASPDLIVIHYTAMVSADAALARLCDPAAKVSAHYLIDEAGTVHPLVPEELRAWHAGAGSWRSVSDVNSRSIGVELANDGRAPFAARQMAALTELLADVRARWGIPAERVIAHSDMAPARKRDPGAAFDWGALALAGQSVWPVIGKGDQPFGDALRDFGYPDAAADVLLAAFRLRFRPWAKGPLDGVDEALARDLAARFPVDAGAARP